VKVALRSCRRAGLLLLSLLLLPAAAGAGNWNALKHDGLHDPGLPALKLLQEPREALIQLPPDTAGNKVDWVKALRDGYIAPRTSLLETEPVETLDSAIIMNRGGSTPLVRFPHLEHTQWLDCENCHEKLFRSEGGATPISMKAILEGEYCGVCHGAVSFPLTECNRCHSVPRD
jgi:c(7)-type cytochrome triheme protein